MAQKISPAPVCCCTHLWAEHTTVVDTMFGGRVVYTHTCLICPCTDYRPQ